MADYDVIIVGAGLAGLTCALRLEEEGLKVRLLDAADTVGGRVGSDRQDGFILDRGFQVFLTAYPECQRWLDYEALQLGAFKPGANIQFRGKKQVISDPWRDPQRLVSTILSTVGNLRDKLLVGRYRRAVMAADLNEIYFSENIPALEALRNFGFSEPMINRFFRPFFSGIFLEEDLQTSRRVLDFVFKMFSEGEAALPAEGMAAVPQQLATRLQPGTLSLGSEVFEIEPGRVELSHGESLTADSIAIAVPFSTVSTLVKGMVFPKRSWQGTTCLYFAAPESPLPEPRLLLNGDRKGLINSMCVPSDVQPAYAPPGQSLISVSLVGAHAVDDVRPVVEKELRAWFPDHFGNWEFLRGYSIERALPRQHVSDMDPIERIEALEPGFYMCGDHRQTSSLQGAMASGRRTAEALIKERRLIAE